jgi:hypothetical protein
LDCRSAAANLLDLFRTGFVPEEGKGKYFTFNSRQIQQAKHWPPSQIYNN